MVCRVGRFDGDESQTCGAVEGFEICGLGLDVVGLES